MPEIIPPTGSVTDRPAGNPVALQLYVPEQPVALNVIENGMPSHATG
jgi:hypothetical protein